jgi:hypothetical protein
MELTEDQAIQFIKDNLKVPVWVSKAREQHKILKALVLGEEFHEVLITRIEKIESEARAVARKKYSKDIRDMFDRVMQPRSTIFNASGGSVHIDIASEVLKDKLIEALNQFKGQKSIRKYLSENFFRLVDTDPNGLLFLEYKEDVDIYPTYKSINDIRTYESNGQLCKVLLFEPKDKKLEGGVTFKEWRLVDSKTDWRVMQLGQKFTIIEDKTFGHPFGKVPATILSDIQEMGSETRISPLFPIEELSKDYARDKSIRTIYKFQHGFPRHWRYIKECRSCQGTGKTGEDICKACNGTGEVRTNDITDIQTIALPREDDQIVTPNIEGFVSPDLETWARYNEDIKDMEDLIESTMWGTKRQTEGEAETATGRFIDVQPVMNKLGVFTDNVQWVHNQLANWVENWVFGMPKESEYHVSYGRRFIIESPDVILDKYTEARTKGDNNTILDKLLDEYILSKYQSDPVMLDKMQKKRFIEPYVHNSTQEVNNLFGRDEAYKKVLFVEFWEEADKNKDADALISEFKTFVDQNKLPTIEVVQPVN